MSLIRKLSEREAPPWMILMALGMAAVALFIVGRQALSGRQGDPLPPKKVYPGMYDLRAEAAKMRAAQQGAAANAGPR